MASATVHGIRFSRVHEPEECVGRHCIVHNPLSTHMDDWPVIYRSDRNLFERVCKHGVGHPDRSQEDYWVETKQEHMVIHGCCGCCLSS
jgi:hypothetical protein